MAAQEMCRSVVERVLRKKELGEGNQLRAVAVPKVNCQSVGREAAVVVPARW